MAEKFAVVAGSRKEAETWARDASLEAKDWVYATDPKQLKDHTVIQTGNWYLASPEVLAAVSGVVEDETKGKEEEKRPA